ncbi:hypothetical protein [Rhodococcus sp. SORGH_AS_0303]|uniref:hypothetical protein n=1 Tax=Rhodococcus sp. SORGH_AS_0303 TaxID=3041753 RepID=UPI0027818C2F|nr:hypothetical protein [Rhodococcus sp. SORGH_AS_0303]MDQ1202851.1 hypothetical protein [Rhodococcus sp. SORGH_AS_0303]
MNERAVVQAARFLSFVLATGAMVVGTFYAGPESLVRRPVRPGQETLVVLVESVFPVWPIIFLLAGSLVLVAAIRMRGLIAAHGVVVAVWAFYALCLILGPILSVPPSPILVGVIAAIVMLTNAAAMRLWAALGVN